MKKYFWNSLAIGFSLILLCSCSSNKDIAKDISLVGKNWVVAIDEMEWADKYELITSKRLKSGMDYTPEAGYKFIIMESEIRNVSQYDGIFDYSKLTINSGNSAWAPFIMVKDFVLGNVRVGSSEKLDAGDDMKRLIVFSVPIGTIPEKVIYDKDGEVAIPLVTEGSESSESKEKTEW